MRFSPTGRIIAGLALAMLLVGVAAAADVTSSDAQETFTIERVSITSDGNQANGLSGVSSVSEDGRFVAFSSRASNLVPGDTNGFFDVFLHDRQTGATLRMSQSSSGTQGNEISSGPHLSQPTASM